jgi:hypothetical protein
MAHDLYSMLVSDSVGAPFRWSGPSSPEGVACWSNDKTLNLKLDDSTPDASSTREWPHTALPPRVTVVFVSSERPDSCAPELGRRPHRGAPASSLAGFVVPDGPDNQLKRDIIFSFLRASDGNSHLGDRQLASCKVSSRSQFTRDAAAPNSACKL